MELRQPALSGFKRRGRPPVKRKATIPHRPRPVIGKTFAAHVTLKLLPRVDTLRTRELYSRIRGAFVAGCDRFGFRLLQYSVQRDHIHLVAEAEGSAALSKGLQGLTIRIAKGLNALLGTHGQVFKERYHLHVLRNPLEVNRTLRYVLNNAAHHSQRRGRPARAGDVDPFSSAGYFDGWAPGWWERRVRGARGEGAAPVASAQTWLLRAGWRLRGLFVPGDTSMA